MLAKWMSEGHASNVSDVDQCMLTHYLVKTDLGRSTFDQKTCSSSGCAIRLTMSLHEGSDLPAPASSMKDTCPWSWGQAKHLVSMFRGRQAGDETVIYRRPVPEEMATCSQERALVAWCPQLCLQKATAYRRAIWPSWTRTRPSSPSTLTSSTMTESVNVEQGGKATRCRNHHQTS